MHNRNQPGRSYVQDNATPISNLFDMRQDKKKSPYTNVVEGFSTNSYSEIPKSFEESQTYQLGTPSRQANVMPIISPDTKLSPAWAFLKQFGSSDTENVDPPTNISDLFDLPSNSKFVTELGNKDGSKECSFETESRDSRHDPFPNRGLSNHFGK